MMLHFITAVLILTCVSHTLPLTSRWGGRLCKSRQSFDHQSAKDSPRTASDWLGCGPAQHIPLPVCTRRSWTPEWWAERQSKTGDNEKVLIDNSDITVNTDCGWVSPVLADLQALPWSVNCSQLNKFKWQSYVSKRHYFIHRLIQGPVALEPL